MRDGSYDAFRSILTDSGRPDLDVRAFWEYWEERNIAHYWEPYRAYKDICELSLDEAFAHFGIKGDPALIRRYFEAFGEQLEQQQTTFKQIAAVQAKAWREAADKFHDAAAKVADARRADVEAAVKKMKSDASGAEERCRN